MVLDIIPPGYRIDLDLSRLALLCTKEIKNSNLYTLTTTSKFLSEIIYSLDESVIVNHDLSTSIDMTDSITTKFVPKFLLGKSLFDNGEYLRSNNIFSSIISQSDKNIPHVVYFFYIYSKFTSFNERNSKSLMKITDLADYLLNIKDFSSSRTDEGLDELKEEIELTTTDHKYLLDSPYILYLYSLILYQLRYKESSLKYLIMCLQQNPLFWDAWNLLVNFVVDKEFLNNILSKFDGHDYFLKNFFEIISCIKIQEFERATEKISSLAASGFANNLHLQSQYALLLEKSRVILDSYQIFKKIFQKDPYFLEYSDVFSNILFVTENKVELSHLAHHCSQVDKFSAKTCCVIGNFYGLIGLHQKALDYFLRAIKLQPTYPLVWMLIGHEYVELKQTKAAIRAYRECVKQNPHQYFAWYGLGQMYELLEIPLLAIRYYQEAYFLFPGDSRPLIALGDMYLKLGKSVDARRCFWKAFTIMDLESGSALLRLAKCFEQINNPIKAAASYTLFINFCDKFGRHSNADLAQAYRFLSEFHVNQKNYIDARIAANKCLQFDSVREEAKSLLSQITNLQLSNENDQIFDNQKPFILFGTEINQGLTEKFDTPLNKINPLKCVPIPLDVLHDMKWIDLEPLDVFCDEIRCDVNLFPPQQHAELSNKSPKSTVDDSLESRANNTLFSLDQISAKHRQLVEKIKAASR